MASSPAAAVEYTFAGAIEFAVEVAWVDEFGGVTG